MTDKKKGVRIILLVEDEMIERFARRVLIALGYHARELRVVPYPVGRGSGKQWIDQQYLVQVKIYRSQAYHQKIALLVGTDADELTVMNRHLTLAGALQVENLVPRSNQERIAIWIPRWNIETWILFLAGDQVDENENYKRRLINPNLVDVADEFVIQYRATRRGEQLI